MRLPSGLLMACLGILPSISFAESKQRLLSSRYSFWVLSQKPLVRNILSREPPLQTKGLESSVGIMPTIFELFDLSRSSPGKRFR